jgi:hypothetical protein
MLNKNPSALVLSPGDNSWETAQRLPLEPRSITLSIGDREREVVLYSLRAGRRVRDGWQVRGGGLPGGDVFFDTAVSTLLEQMVEAKTVKMNFVMEVDRSMGPGIGGLVLLMVGNRILDLRPFVKQLYLNWNSLTRNFQVNNDTESWLALLERLRPVEPEREQEADINSEGDRDA